MKPVKLVFTLLFLCLLVTLSGQDGSQKLLFKMQNGCSVDGIVMFLQENRPSDTLTHVGTYPDWNSNHWRYGFTMQGKLLATSLSKPYKSEGPTEHFPTYHYCSTPDKVYSFEVHSQGYGEYFVKLTDSFPVPDLVYLNWSTRSPSRCISYQLSNGWSSMQLHDPADFTNYTPTIFGDTLTHLASYRDNNDYLATAHINDSMEYLIVWQFHDLIPQDTIIVPDTLGTVVNLGSGYHQGLVVSTLTDSLGFRTWEIKNGQLSLLNSFQADKYPMVSEGFEDTYFIEPDNDSSRVSRIPHDGSNPTSQIVPGKINYLTDGFDFWWPSWYYKELWTTDSSRAIQGFENFNINNLDTLFTSDTMIVFFEGILGCYVGLNEQEEETLHLKAYPNPTSGQLIIEAGHLEKGLEYILEIMDLTGRVYFNKTVFAHDTFQVDAASLPPGLLLVTLHGQQVSRTLRILNP